MVEAVGGYKAGVATGTPGTHAVAGRTAVAGAAGGDGADAAGSVRAEGVRYHADDLGMNHTVNGATGALLAAGRLVGVSLLANGMATAEAVDLVRGCRGLPVHLHLNLTQGRPVARRRAPSDLVGRDGAFLGPHRLVFALVRGEVDPADVEHELEAQLDRLDDLGVPLAGIDSHHHVHAFAPVGEVVERVAARRGLTGGRSYRLMRTHTPGGHGKKLLLSLLARTSSWASTGRGRLPPSWRADLGDAFAVASWERLDRDGAPAGTIVCHPGGACDRRFPPPAMPSPSARASGVFRRRGLQSTSADGWP